MATRARRARRGARDAADGRATPAGVAWAFNAAHMAGDPAPAPGADRDPRAAAPAGDGAAMKTLATRSRQLARRAAGGVAAGRAAPGAGADALRHARRRAAAARPRLPRRAAPRRARAAPVGGRGRVGQEGVAARVARERATRRPSGSRGRSSRSASARGAPSGSRAGSGRRTSRTRPKTPPVFPAPGPLRTGDDPPPATARHLPDRWVVIGYQGRRARAARGGQARSRRRSRSGRRSTRRRCAEPPARRAAARRGHALARRLRGGREGRDGHPRRAHARARDRDARRAARARRRRDAHARRRQRRALEALLDAQRYTRGLAFVAPGTRDEQHGRGRHGLQRAATARRARASRASRPRRRPARPPRSPRACSGSAPRSLAGLEGAARTDELDARHLQTALWPLTGGYFLDQIMGSPAGRAGDVHRRSSSTPPRRHFARRRPRARPAPTLRAGRQPYGVLPVTSLDLFPPGAGGAGPLRREPALPAAAPGRRR